MSCYELYMFNSKTWSLLFDHIMGSFIVTCTSVSSDLNKIIIYYFVLKKNANKWILVNILICNLHMKWNFNFLNYKRREANFCATTEYLQNLTTKSYIYIYICLVTRLRI